MATVHPSRMAFIPQDVRASRSDRTRGRSPSPRRSRSRDRDRNEGRGRDSGSGRGREREDYRTSEPRRASPQYEDYRRPPPPAPASGDPRLLGGRRRACTLHSILVVPELWPSNHFWMSALLCVFHFYTSLNTCSVYLDVALSVRLKLNVWPSSPEAPARELYVAEIF